MFNTKSKNLHFAHFDIAGFSYWEGCMVMNQLKIGDEVQNSRVWLNSFIGDKAKLTITPKTDEVVSQNQFYDSASYTINTVDGVDFAVRETANNVQ